MASFKEIGAQLCQLAKEKKLSSRKVGKLANGIDYRTVDNVFIGHAGVAAGTYEIVANALGKTIHQSLGDKS